ncbi:MAG: hydantoinase B/oxoprolinase family protein, partial [Acidimicrobiia bacterium]
IEIIESTSPLFFRRKEFRTDSGGAGTYRGGLGQVIEVEVRTGEPYVVSSLSDRFLFPAQGYDGGAPGAAGGFSTSFGGAANPKLSIRMPAGESFVLELPGGGGYHQPSDRSPEAVAEDIAEGLVTKAAAAADYGASEQVE